MYKTSWSVLSGLSQEFLHLIIHEDVAAVCCMDQMLICKKCDRFSKIPRVVLSCGFVYRVVRDVDNF